MKAFETTVRVRYAETDAMGVVHHSHYFVWLELARVEWLKALHVDYKTMEKNGFFLPVVQADLTYKSPLFFDDLVRIVLTPSNGYHSVRLTLRYELFRDDTLVTKGFTVHAFINAQRRLIKPPTFFIEALAKNAGN